MDITQAQFLARIKERCEQSFEFFARYFFKVMKGQKFVVADHHRVLFDTLEKVHRGELTHVIINMPPRYGKTEVVVKLFSAWCYALNPACEFIHLSYSEELALDNSGAIKSVIQTKEFQQLWPTPLSKAADGAWKTEAGGSFFARSAGGQVTGYGAGKLNDFNGTQGFGGAIIIDDPLKPTDANSDPLRNAINNRWDAVIKSRFNSPKTPCIVIMQRIHEDDFCGMLTRDVEYRFTQVLLPAIIDEGTDHERALWPEKHSLERLHAMKAKNSYVFSSQMQQRPSPLGGGIIQTKWFGYYDVVPRLKFRAVFVDTAQKEKEHNDFQVASLWGLGEDGYLYLLDMLHARFQAYELEERIPAFWVKAKSDKSSPLRYMGVEDKASGTQLIQTLAHKVKPKIPVKAIQRSRSKLERVMDVQGYIESGYVKLPRNTAWLADFLSECEAFTADDTHAHDDQIDTMCDAISNMLIHSTTLYSDAF